jgi:S-DNA-T family DNA segregation ATPase FtsK/SpoIIIE
MYSLPKLKLRPKTVITVGTIISFVLAGLSLVSLFSDSEVLGVWKNFLMGNLGWSAIFTPAIFFVSGLVLQKLKWAIAQLNVLLGLLIVTLSSSAITAPFSVTYAGVLGDFIWTQIATFITPAGAMLLLLGILLVGVVVLFNTSLTTVFEIVAKSGTFLKERIFDPMFTRTESFEAKDIPVRISGVDDIRPKVKIPTTAVAAKPEIMADELVQNVAGQAAVWKYPPLSLLSEKVGSPADRGDVKKQASIIERTLDSFGIAARVAEVNGGPAVTQYALEISAGTKIAKIANLQHDIALALATPTGTVRVEAPIPGKSLVGIEVPNRSLEVVGLKNLLGSEEMTKQKSKLAVVLGRDTASRPIVVDIAKMPHCLIAGTTGSGKSVMINAFIATLLYRNSPDELKLIMIDPKRVEMSGYNDIPHLLTPVITEPDKILSSLKWAMAEMDRRYKLFQSVGVRNIQAYNEMIDSRVILDGPGAEKLLGRGDMLFMPPDASKPMRIQGVFVQDGEINNLIKFIKSTGMGPQYTAEVTQMPIGKVGGKGGSGDAGDRDDLFEEAVRTIVQYEKASASLLQRRLRVGYARAARLMDELEEAGIIGPGEGSKPRDVLIRNVDDYFANQAAG